jgi:5'-nucleotidase
MCGRLWVKIAPWSALVLAWGLASAVVAEEVPFTILHFNDVYEIVPLSKDGPRLLARLAALRADLKTENPRTYSVLAGDCFSPSPMMEAKYQGKRLAGRQLVAVLEAMKLDEAGNPFFVTFGNHEFDLKRDEFPGVLAAARFRWFSSNVSKPDGTPFHGVPRSRILTVEGDRGARVRVGFIGLTVDSTKKDYVRYTDPFAATRVQLAALRGEFDVLIALTHLERVDDQRLAAAFPEIDLILGGHDHMHSSTRRTVIAMRRSPRRTPTPGPPSSTG